MFSFSSKGVAFMLAIIIALISVAFLSLIKSANFLILTISFAITFVSAFLLIYLVLEFLIFRELNNIYGVIDKLKKKEFTIAGTFIKKGNDPISKIKQEIYTLARLKQIEIEELKKLESYRREFIADVSHELKTPIFSALGFIETLREGAVDDKSVRDRFLKKASKSMQNLNHLVEDLISLSQLETGQAKMEIRDFDLVYLIKDVVDQLEDKAHKKHTNINLFYDNKNTYHVNADRFRISQVFINLIDNAIKYAGENCQINIILDKDKSGIQVIIKDNGVGISDEHLPRLFDRFYRVEKSRSKENGGTGLGLSIVEQILQTHGSKITVTSKLGNGTTFTFKLRKAKEKETIALD